MESFHDSWLDLEIITSSNLRWSSQTRTTNLVFVLLPSMSVQLLTQFLILNYGALNPSVVPVVIRQLRQLAPCPWVGQHPQPCDWSGWCLWWSIYIYTYVHTYIHTYTHIHIYTYTHIHIYTHTHIHIYTYTHIHIYTYTCICTCICTYICTYMSTYAYMHITGMHACMCVIYVCMCMYACAVFMSVWYVCCMYVRYAPRGYAWVVWLCMCDMLYDV